MIKYLLKLHLLLLVISTGVEATVYFPTPLEDQLREAYGVIRGKYQGKVYKKSSRGDVVTEVSISLKETVGLRPGDIINKNNFKVTFIGGKWQGINHKISGAPVFSDNEDVILLIHKGSNGFHLLNFGLGKYSVSKKHGSSILKNAIFPNNSKISGIDFQDFQSMIKRKYGQPLTEFKGEKYVYKPIVKKRKNSKSSRAPASEEIDDTKEKNNNSTMFWLMIVLSLLGTSSYKLFGSRE